MTTLLGFIHLPSIIVHYISKSGPPCFMGWTE